MAERAREHALQFDRVQVFDRLLGRLEQPSGELTPPSRRHRVRAAAGEDRIRLAVRDRTV